MQLFQCHPHEIDKAWRDGAHVLSEATKWAMRDVTTDQLKMLLARGERTLIGMRDGDAVVGWAAVSVNQMPNIRVLHVYAMAGRGIVEPASLALLKEYAAANGCSSIRGCVRPSMLRLMRRLGAQPIYTTFEIDAVEAQP
jgi:hypothetical protein